MTALLSSQSSQSQARRLRQFSFLLTIAAALSAPGEIVIGLLFAVPQLVLVGVGTLIADMCFFVAWRFAEREELTTAVSWLASGLLLAALSGVLAMPSLLPIIAVLPILVVMAGLPYTNSGHLRKLMIIASIAAVFIFIAGSFVQIFPPPPSIFTQIPMVAIGPVTIAFSFLLLWHYAQQLSNLITGLQQAHGTLESQVTERTAQLSASLEETRTSREQALAKQREAEELLVELRAAQAETERQAQEAQRLQQQSQREKEELQHAVTEYLAFTQAIAGGDLAQRVKGSYQGALGQLRDGLNHMAESLQGITGQVQEAVSNISSAASEILAATTQQSAGAAQQSASITQTTTTIEEIKSIAQQTAQQAAQVASDSQKALAIARQGTSSVEETLGGMDQIKARVEGIAETILALAEQTQAISAIIQTVGELADQSNLLALNAAIEAARAGEQGKSFAVVAQHVRDLAERSKGATGQIREILGEIQQATNTAVMVTEEGTKGVTVGAQLASKTGQVIHRIAEEVESGAQANVQMAAAAQQQTAGIEQIGQAMTSIQQATTQTLASTRQAERAARDLTTLAQRLTETLGVYRLR